MNDLLFKACLLEPPGQLQMAARISGDQKFSSRLLNVLKLAIENLLFLAGVFQAEGCRAAAAPACLVQLTIINAWNRLDQITWLLADVLGVAEVARLVVGDGLVNRLEPFGTQTLFSKELADVLDLAVEGL